MQWHFESLYSSRTEVTDEAGGNGMVVVHHKDGTSCEASPSKNLAWLCRCDGARMDGRGISMSAVRNVSCGTLLRCTRVSSAHDVQL